MVLRPMAPSFSAYGTDALDFRQVVRSFCGLLLADELRHRRGDDRADHRWAGRVRRGGSTEKPEHAATGGGAVVVTGGDRAWGSGVVVMLLSPAPLRTCRS